MVADEFGPGALPRGRTPLAAAGGGRGEPPPSDRGVETTTGVVGRFSSSVDFLTLSLPSADAEPLVGSTTVAEAGHGMTGFGRSEQRECLGGLCWRRWQPRQDASGFGRDYESWQFAGQVASFYARQLTGRGRPSRVDVAFDFICEPECIVRRFVDRIRHGLRAGVVPEWVERGDDATFYLGARSSDWRVVIYRKDLQQGSLWAEAFPPVLRIEARMCGRFARDFWQAWSLGQDAGFQMVSGRVRDWLGVSVADKDRDWVETCKPVEFDQAQRLLAFMEQHGAVVHEFARAGVPVLELASIAAANRGRQSQWRSDSRLRQLLTASVPGVVDLVRKSLARPTGPGDSAAVPSLATSGG